MNFRNLLTTAFLFISLFSFGQQGLTSPGINISPTPPFSPGQTFNVTYSVYNGRPGNRDFTVTGNCNQCTPQTGVCTINNIANSTAKTCSVTYNLNPIPSGTPINLTANAINVQGSNITTYVADPVNIVALPIQLLSFTAKMVDDFIALEWSTASELNNEVFLIEKSVDGKNYEVIGKVDGAGNSNTIIKYFFVDENLSKGVAYYRLKQIDFDGTFEYSDIVSVFNDPKNPKLKVYPNPSLDFAYVSLGDNKENLKSINIVNSLGSLVKSFNYGVNNLDEAIRLDLSDLQQGTYYLQVVYKHTTTTELISKL
jgi:hypothetical protein